MPEKIITSKTEKEKSNLDHIKEIILNSRVRTQEEFTKKTGNPWSACFITDLSTVFTYFQIAVRNKEIENPEGYTLIEGVWRKLVQDVRKMVEVDQIKLNSLHGNQLEEALRSTEPSDETKEELFSRLDAIGKMIEKNIINN